MSLSTALATPNVITLTLTLIVTLRYR